MTALDERADVAAAGRWPTPCVVALHVLLVAAVAVAVAWPRGREQDFWFSDASRHALDGMFLLDLVRDGGLAQPQHYALTYAARYPALGVVYYPPLFAVAEGLVYIVAGPGVAAARATIVLFAIAAGMGCYVLGRRIQGGAFGCVAAILFLTMDAVVFWSRDVMLEMPMTAFCILTVLCLHVWVEDGKRWAGVACAACLLAAILTKQSAIHLLCVAPAYILVRKRWRLLWSREAICCYIVGALVLVPYGLFQAHHYGAAVSSTLTARGPLAKLVEVPRWIAFAKAMPSLISWPLVVLALVGAGAGVVRREWTKGRVCLVWLAAAYVSLSYLGYGTTRFAFPVLPAVAFLAALGLWAIVPRRAGKLPLRAVAVVALLAYRSYCGVGADVPWVSDGYRQAAALVMAEPRGETVLFHGYHAGNFAYHVRIADGKRQAIVLRSDKLFGRVHRGLDADARFEAAVSSAEEVQRLLVEHGVGYVVLEPGQAAAAHAIRPLLAAAVANGPWRLRARVPVTSHGAKPGTGEILVYENPRAGRALAESIPFWVPLSGSNVCVPYADLRGQ